MIDDIYDIEDILNAVYGGILMSLACTLYLVFFGGFLGISQIIKDIFKGQLNAQCLNAFTIASGMIFVSAFAKTLYDEHIATVLPFETDSYHTPMIHLVFSGFAVGLGTYLAGGCTSGHGLAGLPRFQFRSIFSVFVFSSTAVLTVTYGLSDYLPSGKGKKQLPLPSNFDALYYAYFSLLIPFMNFVFATKKNLRGLFESLILFLIGCIYALGLMVSGMSLREKVYSLLRYDQNWDPSLLLIYLIAIIGNILTFTFMIKGNKKPIFGERIDLKKEKVTFRLFLGSLIFGLGWGLGGLCPSPYLLYISLDQIRIPLYWGVSYLGGLKFGQFFDSFKNCPIEQISQKQKSE